MKKIKVGILGYGNFGKFIIPHLNKYFEVFIYDPKYPGSNSLKESCSVDYLIFAVTVDNLENLCCEIQESVNVNTQIIDVTSVKVIPLEILQKYFPNNEILGTHPIFGPQSGKNGIENLPIVLCNISFTQHSLNAVKNFLKEKLTLKVIEKNADEHDKEMALVQGLSHFIGRALSIMQIKNVDTATKSYKQLVSLEDLVGNDSWELYQTIQNSNPYANSVREEFLKTLNNLERKLNKS